MPRNNQKVLTILPGQTIGIIGGGQLGRMMAIAARYMGYKIIVLDPAPNCPTAQVADQQIVAAYDDMSAIRKITELSDVVTYEFENVDLQAASYIGEKGKLPQGAYALKITQNREEEKKLLRQSNIPVAQFKIVHNAEACKRALEEIPFPSVIKTCRGGYDGKGQLKINTKDDIDEAGVFADKYHPCVIEEWLSFEQEISVIFSRSQTGDISFFPIGKNDHRDHILYQTTVPATISDRVKEKAYEAATILAEKIQVVGTFTIEMFVNGENIYVNEMAPRPHNSGHYTIEACNVSQFTQHIRAICGLPLADVKLLEPSVMINILGEDLPHVYQKLPTLKNGYVHLYGKDEPKEKRKMGHVTFTGKTLEQVKQLAYDFECESK